MRVPMPVISMRPAPSASSMVSKPLPVEKR
jgi:hypothetical protein